MVEKQLRARGIRDDRMLEAFLEVPRHRFVPDKWNDRAYGDGPIPIGHDQTVSQPYMIAAMIQAARVSPGKRVLDVGTGSGYQAALLAAMKARVFTVERVPELAGRGGGSARRTGLSGCPSASGRRDAGLGGVRAFREHHRRRSVSRNSRRRWWSS